ncbi:carbohydrate ABC transporter permease [Cohnella faecalis]|uniref:Carbohydrate ABC transporter permease n=1 Tax=Cohnella faecalis TaxID=2315694 RepID=A0A398CQ62_9BACL|nr:carbohydrate ABC transporter permease [Cohnella faecalis]RIE01571.1 carbohydrate ABC transporter permease [Cohnella faecalis]
MGQRGAPKNMIGVYIVLFALLIFAIFPVYWMLNTSFKSNAEIYRAIPSYWPSNFDFSGYVKLFKGDFVIQLTNSFVISALVSVGSLFVSVLAAFALSRLNFRFRNFFSRSILYAYLIPKSVMYIPLYIFVSLLGLNNSILGLGVIYPTFVIPYATWMLVAHMKSIPVEIEEAAIVDGSSRLGAMFRVVLPLAWPGIITTLIFSFTLCWSEYLYALVIITKEHSKTITLGLASLIVEDVYPWGTLTAGAIIASIPVIILYFVGSRFMVSGATDGSVKG